MLIANGHCPPEALVEGGWGQAPFISYWTVAGWIHASSIDGFCEWPLFQQMFGSDWGSYLHFTIIHSGCPCPQTSVKKGKVICLRVCSQYLAMLLGKISCILSAFGCVPFLFCFHYFAGIWQCFFSSLFNNCLRPCGFHHLSVCVCFKNDLR